MEETWLAERLDSFGKGEKWGICWWDCIMEGLKFDAVGHGQPL